MKKLFFLLLIQTFMSGLLLNAQEITVKKGSIDFITEQKNILIKYDYSNMGVGNYEKEEDYVNQKVAEYNAVEPGKGDKWKESWLNNRTTRYEPKFEELLNYFTLNKKLLCSKNATDAKYEMVVHTVYSEFGYDAFIDAEITFRKTSDNEEVAVIFFEKCPGGSVGGFDYTVAYRLELAYANLGKALARIIMKKL
jgi:hypothetical protein